MSHDLSYTAQSPIKSGGAQDRSGNDSALFYLRSYTTRTESSDNKLL